MANADSTEQSITARQVLIKTAIIAYDRMGDDDLYQQGEDMRTIVDLELPFANLAAKHVEIINEIMVARKSGESEGA